MYKRGQFIKGEEIIQKVCNIIIPFNNYVLWIKIIDVIEIRVFTYELNVCINQ